MATLSRTIAASSDDARQSNDAVVTSGTNISVDFSYRLAGLRFTNITIPQGATINSATLTVYLPNASYDSPDVTIWGEDIDDAPTFTTADNNISGRTPTTATVVWNAANIGTGWKAAPGLASIIQEIVNRAMWASGNDIALILKGNSTNPLRFNSYDGGASDYATLDIDYTESSQNNGAAAITLGALTASSAGKVTTHGDSWGLSFGPKPWWCSS